MSASSVHFGQSKTRTQREAGAALVEAMVTTVIVALFMSGAFAANSHSLALLRSTKEANAVELCTRDRLEKIRNAPWERMVDPVYLQNTVLSPAGNAFPDLQGLVVGVTVSAYPPPNGTAGAAPITVVRNASGAASISEGGNEKMAAEKTVKVTITASWQASNRIRTKEAYSLVSRGGINGRNK